MSKHYQKQPSSSVSSGVKGEGRDCEKSLLHLLLAIWTEKHFHSLSMNRPN